VQVIAVTRRVLGGLFAILGVVYVERGALALFHLREVVDRWTRVSGDPDFRLDMEAFMAYVGAGAVSVVLLGAATAWNGVAAARGLRSRWLALAIAALPIHWLWLVYRIVGAGRLERSLHDALGRDNAVQFGLVCASYWIMWLLAAARAGSTHRRERRLLTGSGILQR
jgi:hypothetical protein